MSKYYFLGGLSFLSGLLVILYQAISSMMTAGEIVWKKLGLVDILDEKAAKWIDDIPWEMVQVPLEYVVTMPLYILLLGVGVALFVLGGLIDK